MKHGTITFSDYQHWTDVTWKPSDNKLEELARLAFCLPEEVGEMFGKLKRVLRGDYGDIDLNADELPEAVKEDILKEAGDTLYYLARLLLALGIEFDDVAFANVAKLTARLENGTIVGSGDNR